MTFEFDICLTKYAVIATMESFFDISVKISKKQRNLRAKNHCCFWRAKNKTKSFTTIEFHKYTVSNKAIN